VTRDLDETLPEELRQAIESERRWDSMPPDIEERLARRIGDSLASMDAADALPVRAPQERREPLTVVTPLRAVPARQQVLPRVVRKVSLPLRWAAFFAGGLVAAGAMGAGLIAVMEYVAPSEEQPARAPRPPARSVRQEDPLPTPPAPPEEEALPPVPEAPPAAAPPPAITAPAWTKPAAPGRSKVKRAPPPPPVEAVPVETPPSPSEGHTNPLLERDWSLLKLAQAASAQGRYAEALVAVTQHEQDFPSSQLKQEREALRIHALWGLGRREEARAQAKVFAQRFPDSILLEGLRQAIGEE
jgi:hypothetical protein